MLSSLGAGLSLVVAGVIVLAIVSGFVAFRGWPGMRSDGRADSVRMARVASPPAERTAPVVLGGDAADRRAGSRPGSRRTRASRRAGRRIGSARGGSGRGATRGGPGREGGSPGTRAGGTPSSNRSNPSNPSSGSGGSGSGPGTAPRRPPDPVGRAVEGVDRTVDQLTGPRPLDVPQVVDNTTQTVDEVVEDTTQVVQDVVDGAGGAVLP